MCAIVCIRPIWLTIWHPEMHISVDSEFATFGLRLRAPDVHLVRSVHSSAAWAWAEQTLFLPSWTSMTFWLVSGQKLERFMALKYISPSDANIKQKGFSHRTCLTESWNCYGFCRGKKNNSSSESFEIKHIPLAKRVESHVKWASLVVYSWWDRDASWRVPWEQGWIMSVMSRPQWGLGQLWYRSKWSTHQLLYCIVEWKQWNAIKPTSKWFVRSENSSYADSRFVQERWVWLGFISSFIILNKNLVQSSRGMCLWNSLLFSYFDGCCWWGWEESIAGEYIGAQVHKRRLGKIKRLQLFQFCSDLRAFLYFTNVFLSTLNLKQVRESLGWCTFTLSRHLIKIEMKFRHVITIIAAKLSE